MKYWPTKGERVYMCSMCRIPECGMLGPHTVDRMYVDRMYVDRMYVDRMYVDRMYVCRTCLSKANYNSEILDRP
jgi:hypothetical protein